MPKRPPGPPQLLPEDPRWLERRRPFLQQHLTAAFHGVATRSGRELARRLQHAKGRERSQLIAELARLDAWAWPKGTSNVKTIPARAKRIRQPLADARRECLFYDPVTKHARRGRPIDLDAPRWELWLRHHVQKLLTQWHR